MPKNELVLLVAWVADPGLTDAERIATECLRIKESWTSLITGPGSDAMIRRYVRFQYQLLTELAAEMDGLKDLTDFLNRYFGAYLEKDAPAKLELGLTVAQLVMLLRFLQAEGVFGTLRVATLLRFFSKYFRTRKQVQLSYGSMNKLYYSGDQFTAAFIRDLLLKMVARINQVYFP